MPASYHSERTNEHIESETETLSTNRLTISFCANVDLSENKARIEIELRGKRVVCTHWKLWRSGGSVTMLPSECSCHSQIYTAFFVPSCSSDALRKAAYRAQSIVPVILSILKKLLIFTPHIIYCALGGSVRKEFVGDSLI